MEFKEDIRKYFSNKLKASLIGPLSDDEVLEESPKSKYLYGYLSPTPKSEEEVSIAETISDSGNLSIGAIENTSSELNDDDEFEQPLELVYEPSSMGISFQIKTNNELKSTRK